MKRVAAALCGALWVACASPGDSAGGRYHGPPLAVTEDGRDGPVAATPPGEDGGDGDELCQSAADCDDGDPCTDDACDTIAGCLYVSRGADCGVDTVVSNVDTAGGLDSAAGTDSSASPPAPGCDDGEVETCHGDCVTAGWLGDGFCDAAMDCADTGWDGGDCDGTGTDPGPTPDPTPDPEDGCDAGMLATCNGGCVWEAWLGDGQCDFSLDCADHAFDGGDCVGAGRCDSDEVADCHGDCARASFLGDDWCDWDLACEATGWDAGDCSPGTRCDTDEVESCGGTCMSSAWIADGDCDLLLRCAKTAWDGGDCPVEAQCDADDPCCATGQVQACDLTCTAAAQVRDGRCDAHLDCVQAGWDGGDCGRP